MAKKLVDTRMLAIIIGVIITVTMLASLGSASYAVIDNKPGATYMAILLIIIIMLLFWAFIWWIVGNIEAKNIIQRNHIDKIYNLERENEQLRKLLTELSLEKQLKNGPG